jgi:hypothetical protein
MDWSEGCADAREVASKPYSLQLPGALGAGAGAGAVAVARSNVRAGKLGSCGRQSDRVTDGSNRGEIAGGPRADVCGLVRVELVQESAMDRTLARREWSWGDTAALGEW